MVAVRARGSSAPPDAGGCIVVLRAFLLRLPVLIMLDLKLESVLDDAKGWLTFLPSSIDAITPGPNDFLGGLAAAPAGGGAGPDGGGPCGAVLCLLVRNESPLGCSMMPAGSFAVEDAVVCLPLTTALSLLRTLPSRLKPGSSRACILCVPLADLRSCSDTDALFDSWRLLLLAFPARV